MNWAVAGLVYAVAYAALVAALADREWARLVAGNIGLLLPPIAPARRAHSAPPGLARASGRVLGRHRRVGGVVVRRPDRLGVRRAVPLDAAAMVQVAHHPAAVRIGAAAHRAGGLAASRRGGGNRDYRRARHRRARFPHRLPLLVADHRAGHGDPAQSSLALRMLAIVGPLVRLAAVVGLLLAAVAAGNSAWAAVYLRLALGLGLAFVVLVVLRLRPSGATTAPARSTDVGWMLPFFFAAWAAATSPASPPPVRTAARGRRVTRRRYCCSPRCSP